MCNCNPAASEPYRDTPHVAPASSGHTLRTLKKRALHLQRVARERSRPVQLHDGDRRLQRPSVLRPVPRAEQGKADAGVPGA